MQQRRSLAIRCHSLDVTSLAPRNPQEHGLNNRKYGVIDGCPTNQLIPGDAAPQWRHIPEFLRYHHSQWPIKRHNSENDSLDGQPHETQRSQRRPRASFSCLRKQRGEADDCDNGVDEHGVHTGEDRGEPPTVVFRGVAGCREKEFENNWSERDEQKGDVDGQDGAFRTGALWWVVETQDETSGC